MYLGDFKEDGDIFHKFSTRAFSTGVPTTLSGSPVLSVYKDEGGAASEKTTAEAYFDLDVDHDSIAGFNNVRIDLSGDAFFATGADYAVLITTGTVDSVNVFGEVLFTFSIENRSMGQPAGATLAADIAALKAETALIVADTNELQGDDVPTLIATAQSDLDTITGTAGVLIGTDAANVTEISDAVWDEAQSGHVGAGTFGVIASEIAAIPTTAMRGTDSAALASVCTEGRLAELDAANLPTATDAAVTDLANATDGLGALKTLIDALNDAPAVTAADIADAVWDEAQADHVAAGSFGITASEIASILVDTATTLQGELDAIQAAVITNAAGADIAADIIAMKAETALIVADSGELQTDWANGGRLDLLIDAIKAATDLLSAAQSEPTGVPAANETPLVKVAYLFMALRNKMTVTGSKKTFYGDDGVAEFEQDLTDDGTTFTQTEINSI